MANRNLVNIRVHKDWFDKIFETSRKQFSKDLGIELSQSKFTEYLSKTNVRFTKQKIRNQFAPKLRKGGRLDFRLNL